MSINGWKFICVETDNNTGERVITAQGQVLSPIGPAHWLVQFFGERSGYCKTLSAERLTALTLFPNDQRMNLFLAEAFPPDPEEIGEAGFEAIPPERVGDVPTGNGVDLETEVEQHVEDLTDLAALAAAVDDKPEAADDAQGIPEPTFSGEDTLSGG